MQKETNAIDNWIAAEIKTANLGDERLNDRLGKLLGMLSRKPTESIPATSKGWDETKAAYRFFDNIKVTAEKIQQPHQDATIERMRQEPVILIVQDTTELDYSDKPQTKGLGKLSYEKQLGMLLHPSIAVTPERVCLGIIDTQILIREKLKRTISLSLLPIISFLLTNDNYQMLLLCLYLVKKPKRQRTDIFPIEKKESIRWLNSYRAAQELSEKLPHTQVVNIADREGDIYEIFVEASQEKKECRADFIIRNNQNRLLIADNKKEYPKLKKKIGESAVLGIVEFDLPAAKGRKARRVKQEIRAASFILKSPKRKGNKLPQVSINVVLAREVGAPVNVAPIEWILVTSLPIDTAEQAIQVITWYLCRWQIEIFFRILKSGCEVEELQLQAVDRLKPCIALYMVIAWRILYMTMIGRSCPEMPCSAVFEDEEWHAVYVVIHRCPPPKIPPDLNSMIKMVASLGGFLNRKSDGYPGPQTIWIGLQRTRDFVIAMEALNAIKI